jgi:hypothetical protein
MKNYKTGPSPELYAETIFKAVNDNSSKLRYTTDFTTKLAFSLRALLPLSLFRNIVNRLVN